MCEGVVWAEELYRTFGSRALCWLSDKLRNDTLFFFFKQKAAYDTKVCLEFRRLFFFFQAEDGIRDSSVTGVQTCALPISRIAGNLRVDASQFDPRSPYYDPKSSPDKPRWLTLDVQALRKTRTLQIAEIGRASCRERV